MDDGAPSARARPSASASVVLPEPAGPSTHSSRPAPSVAGRDRASASTVEHEPLASEGVSVAAIGRHHVDEGAPGEQVRPCWRARTAHRTWRAGTTPGRRPRAGRPGVRSAASGPRPLPRARSGAGPAGAHGDRQPVRPGSSGGDEPATVDGGHLRGRAAASPAARRTPPGGGRRTGSGRTGPGRAARSPAATSVTTGSAAVSSTEPEPPAFQNSSSATPASALGDLAAAYGQLGQRRRLHPAHDERPGALVGHVVGDAGDLALVGHHADQVEPGARRRRCGPARTTAAVS